MKRAPTPQQKEAAAARRTAFRAMAKRIADMTDAERDTLAASMFRLVTVEGRRLSRCNTCLIAHQMPTATMVGGFRQWLKAGRCVRKGQHGLMIWIPTGGTTGNDAEQAPNADADPTRFIVGTVFDVTQTDEITADAESPAMSAA